jgi:hypothetical protein
MDAQSERNTPASDHCRRHPSFDLQLIVRLHYCLPILTIGPRPSSFDLSVTLIAVPNSQPSQGVFIMVTIMNINVKAWLHVVEPQSCTMVHFRPCKRSHGPKCTCLARQMHLGAVPQSGGSQGVHLGAWRGCLALEMPLRPIRRDHRLQPLQPSQCPENAFPADPPDGRERVQLVVRHRA